MLVGFSEQVIDPIFPTELVGYDVNQNATSVNDDVYVKAIVFDDGTLRKLMLCYDVLGFDNLFLKPLYELCEKYSINHKNVFASATHTHSAPGGLIDVDEGIIKGSGYILGYVDEEWLINVLKSSDIAISKAIKNLSEGSIKYGENIVHYVGANRNDINLPGDDDLIVLEIKNQDTKIILYNFACHPTILKGDNLKISADFPGVINKLLKNKGYEFAFFLNGSAGDISTRFTRKNDSYAELYRLSNILFAGIEEVLDDLIEMNFNVKYDWMTVELKIKSSDSLENATRIFKKYTDKLAYLSNNEGNIAKRRTYESFVEGAKANLEYAKLGFKGGIFEMDVSFITIGDFTFVGVPGELYSELTNPIKQNKIGFVSFANGYYGYIANSNAFKNNYYEAQSSPFISGEAEKLIVAISNKLNTY